MKFTTDRESLLRALQLVTGVVERRQTLPVLSNLLLVADQNGLSLCGTDLEVELLARIESVDVAQPGEVTVPARKLADIWRSLPDNAKVSVEVEGERSIVRSGRSRFALATLPAGDFPRLGADTGDARVSIEFGALKGLLDAVSFSMAQQDVRYFLNGMLLELDAAHTRAVATDGHRLAMATHPQGVEGLSQVRAIVPRKGVIELGRLIDEEAGEIALTLGSNHLRAEQGPFTLTTKLVDGQFPDYEKVVPRGGAAVMEADRQTLKQAFQRASILSNEKYRGIRLLLQNEQLTIQANNPEQEEAEEVVPVVYEGSDLEIGFNVSYLQDVLNVLSTDQVKFSISEANSSALIEGESEPESVYVVMPMRL